MSGVAELLTEARSGIRRYEPTEALARSANGSVLIDLRSHDERSMAAPPRVDGLPGMGGPDR